MSVDNKVVMIEVSGHDNLIQHCSDVTAGLSSDDTSIVRAYLGVTIVDEAAAAEAPTELL